VISSGTYEIGPSQGTLQLHTGREGAAKKLGHDLIIQAGKWTAKVNVDADDLTRSTASVTVDVRSLEVVSGTGGAKSLSDKDRRDIKENINKVLKSDKFPEITFTSSRVDASGIDKATVHGDLTIIGTARPASMDISISGSKATGTMAVKQTEWGIKPYSAMMGALKLADTLRIVVEANVPA